MNYLLLKFVHILSSTILFGTGIGTAFFMLQAYRSKNIHAITVVNRNVVIADTLFTTPAVLIQPLTGYLLVETVGFSWSSGWLIWAMIFYVLVGVCWLPVVWLQYRLYQMANESVANQSSLPELYHKYFKIWFLLGWPAFIMMVAIFYMMVTKSPS